MNPLKKDCASDNDLKRAVNSGEQGFTLIEAAISFLVLLIVSVGVASLFVYAVKANSGGENRAMSAAVAQQHIERFRSVDFDDLATAVTDTGGSPKTVTSGTRSFTVTTTITDGPTVDGAVRIKTITVQVSPRAAGAQQWAGTFTITTLRSSQQDGPYK